MSHAAWENQYSLFWENPLGTKEATGWLWLTSKPDTLSLGAEATKRDVYGNRYLLNSHLQVLKSTPSGALGETQMWFESSGTQTKLNRVLNSHFQNVTETCPVPPLPCYVAHWPVSEQPSTLRGFTVARDIGLGLGSAYVWSSCVADKLRVDWAPGKAVTVMPTFAALDGQPNTAPGGIVATDSSYQYQLYQAPNIECLWNGTRFQTAGFTINSSNGVQIKHGNDSLSPVGMTLGRFNATLSLKTWIDDDFMSRFVPDYLGSGISTELTGTFMAIVTGPTITTGTEIEQFTGTIYFHGKIVDIPSANPTTDSLQTINMEMTSPESGSAWTDAGYYIKIDSRYYDWQSVT